MKVQLHAFLTPALMEASKREENLGENGRIILEWILEK
jgi:hypothetical protein